MDPPTTARDRWALAGVLCVAVVLRVWGIGFGLPHLEARPDEIEVVQRAIRLLSGDLNPHFFHYPSLYFYLLGGIYALWGGWTAVLGGSWAGFLSGAAVDPSGFVLVGRLVSALSGVATVYAVYRVGTWLATPRVGLIAAASLSVAHLHVRDSHFATTDVTLTLFLTLAVFHLLQVSERGGLRAYLWAGLFTGFATSTKYVGLLLPGVLAFAHGVRHAGATDSTWPNRVRAAGRDPLAWAFVATATAAFFLTTPFALLDWGLFSTHFRFQMGHLSGGHGLDLGMGGIYHLRHTLPKALGWPLFSSAVIGAGWALLRHPRRAVVLFLFPALFYLSTLTGRTVFLRYMIPLLPFFCLAAGWWLSALMERVGMRFWPVFVVGATGLWWTPLSDSIRTDRLLSQSDTRNLAAEWLLAEVGEGSHSIHQTGAKWGQLQLPLTRDSLAVLRSRALHARSVPGLERLRAYTLMQANARLTAVQDSDLGFRTVAFSGTSGPTASGFFGEEVPEWIAVMRSPLMQYSIVPEPLDSILAADYALAVEFRASRVGRTGWYDQHDAFYLPFKRMDSVARPGPDVSLYRRTAPADSVGTNPGGIR